MISISKKLRASFEKVYVIMNGPFVNNLNWGKIIADLQDEKAAILITNGFLSSSILPDHHNIFVLGFDPVIDWLLTNNHFDLNLNKDSDLAFFNNQHPLFPLDLLNCLQNDINACKKLASFSHTRYVTSLSYAPDSLKADRVILYPLSRFEKYLRHFTYKWYQIGQEPEFPYKFSPRSWPYDSRLIRFAARRFKFFASAWLFFNSLQTPNTFYRALNFALKISSKSILFAGRNNDLGDWLLRDNLHNLANKHIVEYRYFYSSDIQKLTIQSYEGLMQQALYSSQYIRMLNETSYPVTISCIDESFCFRDFFKHGYTI